VHKEDDTGYLKISNLYKEQTILELPEVYALEKIHGTSAHIKFKDGNLTFYSGGETHERFVALFDQNHLKTAFAAFAQGEITVYGEAYGGKMQGMRETYGDELKFVVFEVKFNDTWLTVPHAHAAATMLKLEFVDYVKIPTTMDAINAERDRDSAQAIRNGIGTGKKREGVVLRPLEELVDSRGNRIIAKHKNAEFCETKTVREVNPDKAKVLKEAVAIADEWVTPMRLQHVLDKAQAVMNNMRGIEMAPLDIKDTKTVIHMMIEDVRTEAKGEILESKDAMAAIGRRTAHLYHDWLATQLKESYE
jgi:uncharacterized protein (DUF1778 family)